jgi:hypothetical protein
LELRLDELKAESENKFLLKQQGDSARPIVDALYPNILKDIEMIKTHTHNIVEHAAKMQR